MLCAEFHLDFLSILEWILIIIHGAKFWFLKASEDEHVSCIVYMEVVSKAIQSLTSTNVYSHAYVDLEADMSSYRVFSFFF